MLSTDGTIPATGRRAHHAADSRSFRRYARRRDHDGFLRRIVRQRASERARKPSTAELVIRFLEQFDRMEFSEPVLRELIKQRIAIQLIERTVHQQFLILIVFIVALE
ncbi:MAG: hypothetical protein ACREUT_04930 [Steroidobacteraceae bacterium]